MSKVNDLQARTTVKELTDLLDDGYMVALARGHGVVVVSVTDDGRRVAAAREQTLFDALGVAHAQSPTREIKTGDRVKWPYFRHGVRGQCVGIVIGILPSKTARKIKDACNFLLVDYSYRKHTLVEVERHYSTLLAISEWSCLVSVKDGPYRRLLYRPRQVELCEPGDSRDGVYPK